MMSPSHIGARVLRSLICFLIPSIPFSATVELPHGVPSSMASFYRVGRTFSCMDGSASIPWTKVNDNYCDCLDGSDEPGTPACRRGVFHCKDTQYKLSSIPTAYLQDGFCDCCDGSDEYGSAATCESNCGALAAAVEQARSAKREELERGHKMFKEQAELLKIRLAKEEEERAAAEEAARLAAEKAALEPPPETLPASPEDGNNTNSSESVGEPTGPDSSAPVESSPLPDHPEEGENIHSDEPNPDVEQGDQSTTPTEPEPKVEPKDYGPDNIFRILDDMTDCLKLTDQQYTYELCGLKEVFQREGSEHNNRISLGRWAGWGHSNEGTPSEHKYTTMLFINGLSCWNGPQRSTKVIVQCGPTNELIGVSEPSRCEYVMHLKTYAACFETPEVLFKRLHSDEL